MQQRYDLIVFSLLIFACVIVIALVASPKPFAIQEWQTLMASFVALGAATLAYNAAMAKVRADQAAADKTASLARLNIHLRLEYSLQLLRDTARNALKKTDQGLADRRSFTAAEIVYDEPPEIAEAWLSLSSFSVRTVTLLRTLRATMHLMKRDLSNFDDKQLYPVNPDFSFANLRIEILTPLFGSIQNHWLSNAPRA